MVTFPVFAAASSDSTLLFVARDAGIAYLACVSTQTSQRTATSVVLLGATAIAFAPIFAVLASRHEPLAPTVTAFWRVLLSIPFLTVLAWRQHRSDPTPSHLGRVMPSLVLPGVLFAIDLSCWHTSMAHISAGLATMLGNLAVVIVPAGAWILLGEPYNRRYIPATALAVAGAALICLPPDPAVESALGLPGADYAFGNALAAGTAFAYAGYQLSIKNARRFAGTWSVMACSTATTAVLLFAVTATQPGQLVPRQADTWLTLLGLALISHCLGQGIVAWALNKLPVHLVALLLLWQPACSALLSVFLLSQPMSALQWVGTGTMILALALAQARGFFWDCIRRGSTRS